MPPKGKGGNNNNNKPAAKKSKAKNKEDPEFDELMKQLATATQKAGEERSKKNKKPIMTQEQRRALHREKVQQKNKEQSNGLMEMIARQQKEVELRRMLQQMMQSPFGLKPNREFSYQEESSAKYEACCGWMQGWRAEMEDAHIVDPNFNKEDNAGFFAVFDGHAGAKCAEMCQKLFPEAARRHYKEGTINFEDLYPEMDKTLREKLVERSGCTAVSVFVNDKEVVCANVGDSRAVLCRKGGEAVSLSFDHKPENPEEKERIEKIGGFVQENRVNGQLAMSRALGDFQYKENKSKPDEEQLVICTPEVVPVPREEGDEFILLACDGIFDVLTNQEAVTFVRNEMQANPDAPLKEICEKVCHRCMSPESPTGGPVRPLGTDNMTITIVKLK